MKIYVDSDLPKNIVEEIRTHFLYSIDWLREDKIFATREEAEHKLAEIKGKKDD